RQSARRDIGVKIAEQQRALKKHQARRPDRRRASKPGKNYFGEERLNPKQKKRTEENRGRQQQRMRAARLRGHGRRGFRNDIAMELRTGQSFSSQRSLCACLCTLGVKPFSFSQPKSANSRAARL